jgi:hypothetical protein
VKMFSPDTGDRLSARGGLWSKRKGRARPSAVPNSPLCRLNGTTGSRALPIPRRSRVSPPLVWQKDSVNHMDHAIRLEDIRNRHRRNIALVVFQDNVLALHHCGQGSTADGV